MKITIIKYAISTEGDQVAVHFGRCSKYTFVEIDDGKVVNKTVIENPSATQHAPGEIPKFLRDNGATVVVTGGMGGRAIQFFEQFNIRVVLGASGPVDATIQIILNEELKNGINIAHPDGDHSHQH